MKLEPQDCNTLVDAFLSYEGLVRRFVIEERATYTKTQAMALTTIAFGGPLTMGKLAEWLAVSKEQATRAVAPLVRDGLVARSGDESNRRLVLVSVTEQGEECLKRMFEERDAVISQSLAALDDDEVRELVAASRTAARLLAKALGSGSSRP